MIKIKKELLEQVKRSMKQDPKYIPKILKRLDLNIKGVIHTLLEYGLPASVMFATFYQCCENGLENFNLTTDKFDCSAYLKEIRQNNPEVGEFIDISIRLGRNQLWIMVILYRIFESELEIRCMT